MGDDEREELDHRDPEVREERGDDRTPRLAPGLAFELALELASRLARGHRGLPAIVRHYSMIPPRVIASTSSARSSWASVINFRARTI